MSRQLSFYEPSTQLFMNLQLSFVREPSTFRQASRNCDSCIGSDFPAPRRDTFSGGVVLRRRASMTFFPFFLYQIFLFFCTRFFRFFLYQAFNQSTRPKNQSTCPKRRRGTATAASARTSQPRHLQSTLQEESVNFDFVFTRKGI
jgi:hypothetical protein